MRYNFPIKILNNLNLTVVQGFHVAAPVGLDQALKVQTTDHLGVDVVCGTNEQTWGQECVWPFPWPGIVYDAQVDSTFGAKEHAHSQIDTADPATGIEYSLVYLHLSSVTKTKIDTDSTYIRYNQGDTIGKIGNNGAVTPLPTPAHPLDGTHLHLGIGVRRPGELNYTMEDPQLYLDVTSPFREGQPIPLPTPVVAPADIKAEVQVLNETTDPSVRQSLISLIISQAIAWIKSFNS